MKDEKDVKAKVKKLLDRHDWYWWMPPANGYGKVGISDFHAIKDGVFLAIETKFGSNKPTHHQRAFLESINANTAYGFVVNDKNLEWLDTFLETFGEQAKEVATNNRMSNEAGARLIDAIRELQALI
jgi:hypothetical protein